jgi:CelD/BcsL family acetyltransferase involved in cellulose biosynthesis
VQEPPIPGDNMGSLREAGAGPELVLYDSLEDFGGLEDAWDQLAVRAENPFLTHGWLRSWWSAFGDQKTIAIVLRGSDGSVHAGACLFRESDRALRGAANDYSEEWDVVAVDDSARRLLWRQIADLPAARLVIAGLPAAGPSIAIATDALKTAGYNVAIVRRQLSPWLVLPETWEQLLSSGGRHLRYRVRRYARDLEDEGKVVFRTTSGPEIRGDLERFLTLEASGWKGAAGTAILSDARTRQLYSDFAHAAARRGWLRLHLLDLDGVTIAADYSCAVGGGAFLLKTCFDERYARLSPGLVLRANALRAAIQEGLRFYDFLGGPDPYKVRWTAEVRERLLVRGYRGISTLPTFLWRHKVRPVAGRLRRLPRPAEPPLDRSGGAPSSPAAKAAGPPVARAGPSRGVPRRSLDAVGGSSPPSRAARTFGPSDGHSLKACTLHR